MFLLKCPHCAHQAAVDQITPGSLNQCAQCGKRFVVDNQTAAQQQSPAPPPPEPVIPVDTQPEQPDPPDPSAALTSPAAPTAPVAARFRARRKRRNSLFSLFVIAVVIVAFAGLVALIVHLARTPPADRRDTVRQWINDDDSPDATAPIDDPHSLNSDLPTMPVRPVSAPRWHQPPLPTPATVDPNAPRAHSDLQVLDPRIEWLDGQAYLRLRLLNESPQVHAAPLITADIIDQDNLLTAQMTCEIPAFAPEDLIYLRIPVPAGYDTNWLDDEGIAAVDAFVTINPGSTPDNIVPLSFGDLPVRQTDVTPTQTVLRITVYNARSHPIQEITIVLDAIDSDGHPLGPWIGTVAADVDPQREFTFHVALPTHPSHPLRNLNVRGYAIKP